MAPQPGKQPIAMYILPNISRSKAKQTMKCGQLIEHYIRNIFREKLYTKRCGETIPRSFSERSKLSLYLPQQSKVLYSLL